MLAIYSIPLSLIHISGYVSKYIENPPTAWEIPAEYLTDERFNTLITEADVYQRQLLALGFQAFLIMICVGIYAVLVEGISTSGDNISAAIWGCMGYTVLLCYTCLLYTSRCV